MISVHHPIPSQPSPASLVSSSQAIAAWIAAATSRFSVEDIRRIQHACDVAAPLYAEQLELTGVSRLQQALGTASILIDMHMDADTIAATILHAVPDYLADWQTVLGAQFGQVVTNLVEGMTRMQQIEALTELDALAPADKKNNNQAEQIEGLRKMLLAMVEDIRVVLIKLAAQTHTLRSLSGASAAQQQQIAQVSQRIFAPLANRLGVWQIKWELEDLSLRYLEPKLYKEVAKLLDERRVDREQYIIDVVHQLKDELSKASIKGEVSGRPKHIYSIIKKMKSKHLDFNELYDVRAVRILVDDIKDCYSALGLIHHLWQPIPGEFDDYIARPKSNHYRSLHTAVIGPRGLALEVQIRTFDMHQHSELGVAAHWRYKEGGKSDAKFDEKVAWLRQILSWKDEVADSGDLLEQFKSELFQDQVYVLTPQGKVIALPKGATPIDFAYSVHTDLGHRTRGAKVNGSIVPLNTKLQNGQRVEILTAKYGAPSRDWLSSSLGFLQSPSARAKVRHWFKYQHFDEHVAQGRAKLERELHRAGAGMLNQEKLAHKLQFHKLEDCLAAIGRGDVSEHQLALAIQEEILPNAVEVSQPRPPKRNLTAQQQSGVVLEGIGHVHTTTAKCCKPMPPDTIVGYLTRDHGVTLHRTACSFITRLAEDRRNRVLNAQWGQQQQSYTEVEIEIEAHDRQGLLRDITEVFVREKINASKANTMTRHHLALMQFAISIADREQLSRLLALIQQVTSVISARRRL